jgi:CheY-like chemotaxis protein
MMPVMNGWTLYERMKADPALSSIPVCVLSVATSELPAAECVLAKPISVARLLEVVHQHAVGA